MSDSVVAKGRKPRQELGLALRKVADIAFAATVLALLPAVVSTAADARPAFLETAASTFTFMTPAGGGIHRGP